jgi:hypothetical protein
MLYTGGYRLNVNIFLKFKKKAVAITRIVGMAAIESEMNITCID